MKIKELSENERPRERLILNGSKALSNAELLAIVLRQGSPKESVIMLANRILKGYNLRDLSRAQISELKKLKGIGDAKACQILACFELARRLASFSDQKKVQVNSANDIAKRFLPELSTARQEHCVGVYLDSRKRIIKQQTLFIGSLNSSIIHPREIFHLAMIEGAAAFILVHNHPSGDPSPSSEDCEITEQLVTAGKIMEIELLDHVIIGRSSYFSFQEEGLI